MTYLVQQALLTAFSTKENRICLKFAVAVEHECRENAASPDLKSQSQLEFLVCLEHLLLVICDLCFLLLNIRHKHKASHLHDEVNVL